MSNADAQTSANEFGINRIYVKDVSYEAPNTPTIFQTEWDPKMELNLDTSSQKIVEDIYEVVISSTITAKIKDQVAFLIEVKQAGIFTVKGFSAEQLDQMLGIFCPNVLFPYLRSTVSDLVIQGSFPPLYLAPINFEAFYNEKKKQAATATK